jgi:hypothetical protein
MASQHVNLPPGRIVNPRSPFSFGINLSLLIDLFELGKGFFSFNCTWIPVCAWSGVIASFPNFINPSSILIRHLFCLNLFSFFSVDFLVQA